MKYLLYIYCLFSSYGFSQNVSFDIYFDLGEFTLLEKHRKDIDAKINVLDSTKQYDFTIKGYTDFIDTDRFNLELSKNRAAAVSTYILRKHKTYVKSMHEEALGELPVLNENQYKNVGVKKHRKTSITIVKENHIPKPTQRKRSIYAIPVQKLKVGEIYSVGTINFKIGRITLIKSSKKELLKLLRFLKKNRNVYIEVQGHVCCGGTKDTDAINRDSGTRTLSVDRARFIYNYLISRGISKKRLSYRGYAFTAPLIFPEISVKDQAQNRRVEIKILKM